MRREPSALRKVQFADSTEAERRATHDTATTSSPTATSPAPPPNSLLQNSPSTAWTHESADRTTAPTRQRTRTHRYATSDPGHASLAAAMSVVFPTPPAPPAAPSSSPSAPPPERAPTRMRTVPGYRTAHATHVRPTGLDAVLEGVATDRARVGYEYVYTGVRAGDDEMLPFPRRTWAGERFGEGSTGALGGASTAEFGSEAGGSVGGSASGEGRRRANKLRKGRPRRVSGRASPVRRSSSGMSPVRRPSDGRSPIRRSPSPSKKRTRAVSLGWRRLGLRKRNESSAGQIKESAARAMEGYVVEPFTGRLDYRDERPLSYLSTTSAVAESFCTARASMASPAVPPESRPMSMVSWDSRVWDGVRTSVAEDGDGGASV